MLLVLVAGTQTSDFFVGVRIVVRHTTVQAVGGSHIDCLIAPNCGYANVLVGFLSSRKLCVLL